VVFCAGAGLRRARTSVGDLQRGTLASPLSFVGEFGCSARMLGQRNHDD
jgi:hypothetical protein